MEHFITISVNDAANKLQQQQAILVDIRDNQSFHAGHVQHAIQLTDQSLVSFLQQHDFDTPIMVLCYHGISSQGAAQYLINQGFEEVYSVAGGFEAWAHNFPEHVVTDTIK